MLRLFFCQASSSDEDEDEIGPSVAGKEKRVASQMYAIILRQFNRNSRIFLLTTDEANIGARLIERQQFLHLCISSCVVTNLFFATFARVSVEHSDTDQIRLLLPRARLSLVAFDFFPDHCFQRSCGELAHPCSCVRPEAGSAKRQRREELKRAAEWEKATGVLRGSQAALEKEVNQ